MLKCKNIQIFFLQPNPFLFTCLLLLLLLSLLFFQPHPGAHLLWLPITITLPLYFINAGSQGAAGSNGPWWSCETTTVSNLSKVKLDSFTLLVSWTWINRKDRVRKTSQSIYINCRLPFGKWHKWFYINILCTLYIFKHMYLNTCCKQQVKSTFIFEAFKFIILNLDKSSVLTILTFLSSEVEGVSCHTI